MNVVTRPYLFQCTLLFPQLCKHQCSVACCINGTIKALSGGAAPTPEPLQAATPAANNQHLSMLLQSSCCNAAYRQTSITIQLDGVLHMCLRLRGAVNSGYAASGRHTPHVLVVLFDTCTHVLQCSAIHRATQTVPQQLQAKVVCCRSPAYSGRYKYNMKQDKCNVLDSSIASHQSVNNTHLGLLEQLA